MMKDPNNTDTLTMTVKLRTGECFARVDTTTRPFGDSEKVVAFWFRGSVRIYPMDLIEYVEMHTEDA